jgi:hypothetical protein
MSAGRAKKGGQTGMNGEFYKGGTFLPNTTLPKRDAKTRVKGTGRVLIEPGVFSVCPEGQMSIFNRIRTFVKIDGEVLTPAFPEDHPSYAYYFTNYAEFAKLMEQYNNGERFY